LRAGDTVHASAAAGSFTDDPATSTWWIASGTGVAPFAAMLRAGLANQAGTARKVLLHGSRYLDGFYYRSEMLAVLGADYVPCGSTESDRGVYPGRLTTYLQDLPSFPQDTRYMLCGATGMIIQVRDMLLSAGITFSNIVSEIYF